MTMLPPKLNAAASMGEAISARLTSLGALSDEDGALTKQYLSPAHRKTTDLVTRWMFEAGMSARIDPVGNVVGRGGPSPRQDRRPERAHAGATPMPLRRDALAAAAVMISAIEHRARAEPELVATVGRLEIAHPAANTVPGAAGFTLDVRAPADVVRKAAVRDIGDTVAEIARLRGVQAEIEMGFEAPSSLSDSALSNGLAASVERLGLTVRRLPSGAGHDAMAFRGRIPFAMLFVRCRGGVSHNPAEYAAPEDIDVGAKVLLDFVERLTPANS